MANVNGLSDIAGYVTQLINLERSTGPEQYYQTQKNTLTLKSSTLTDLKTNLSALNTQAQSLGQAGTLSPLALKTVAFGTSNIATGTATSAAANGTHSLIVTQLAKQSTILSTQLASSDTGLAASVGVGDQSFRISVGGVETDITVSIGAADSNQTVLSKMAAAINGSGAAVSASVVLDTDATARLVVLSKQTGAANAITLQDLSGTLLAASGTDSAVQSSGGSGGALYGPAALDARFTLDGLAISRGSNTIADLLTGVTLTLTAAQADGAPPISFTVGPDQSGIQAKVQAFLDAYNTTIKFLTDRTGVTVTPNTNSTDGSSADAVTVSRGTLASDFTYLGLLMNLRSDVGGRITSANAASVRSLVDIGISIGSDGTLAVSDASKLTAALTSAPDGVIALFNSSDGIAGRVTNRLTSFVKTGGVVDTTQQGISDFMTRMNDAINRQEELLKIRQEQLTKQYEALAAVMAQLQSQQGIVTAYLSSITS